MSMIMGGTSGVTFPNSTNLPASNVTALLNPAVTDTANVMTIQPNVIVDGTNGLYANGTVYTSPATSFSLSHWIIGGGGGGGDFIAGGGGGGGYLGVVSTSLLTYTAYTVTVGAGGAVSTIGNNSVFATYTANGGGKGGNYETDGGSGGSGGGSGGTSGAPSRAYSGGGATQGSVGGNTSQVAVIGAAGGGGAGSSGISSTSNGSGQNGGNGTSTTITGSSVTYAGGGGGGNRTYAGDNGGNGGTGGGGNGGGTNHASSAGGTNTGGGGGGMGFGTYDGQAGGSGIVIIKIPNTNTATFSAGVTSSMSTAVSGYKVYTVTATSTTSETVTFT